MLLLSMQPPNRSLHRIRILPSRLGESIDWSHSEKVWTILEELYFSYAMCRLLGSWLRLRKDSCIDTSQLDLLEMPKSQLIEIFNESESEVYFQYFHIQFKVKLLMFEGPVGRKRNLWNHRTELSSDVMIHPKSNMNWIHWEVHHDSL